MRRKKPLSELASGLKFHYIVFLDVPELHFFGRGRAPVTLHGYCLMPALRALNFGILEKPERRSSHSGIAKRPASVCCVC